MYLCRMRNEMDEKAHLIDFRELLPASVKEELNRYEIACFEIRQEYLDRMIHAPFYSDSYIYLLGISGELSLTVNYKTYHFTPESIAVLTPLHIIHFMENSGPFACFFLMVNKPFLDIVPSMEKVFKHVNRSLKLFNKPVVGLPTDDHVVLRKCLKEIGQRIVQTDHLLQKELLQNSFIRFLLEWINIYEKYTRRNPSNVDLNRSEQILKSLIALIKEHFKKEHHVPFYAEKLHVTPQYLTFIVKRLTGQTVNEFIYEMLYSEARILLSRTGLSIQQIAEELHFSDASAFCKFFKRRAGVSPLKFRKE